MTGVRATFDEYVLEGNIAGVFDDDLVDKRRPLTVTERRSSNLVSIDDSFRCRPERMSCRPLKWFLHLREALSIDSTTIHHLKSYFTDSGSSVGVGAIGIVEPCNFGTRLGTDDGRQ